MTDKPKRVEILEKGAALTSGDRNQSYGDPFMNLTCYAQMVDAYLRGKGWTGEALNSVDGAILMNLAKVSRVAVNQQHEDNYVDGATYFAIGGECAHRLAPMRNWDSGKIQFYAPSGTPFEIVHDGEGGMHFGHLVDHYCGICRKNQKFMPNGELMSCPDCGLQKRNPTHIE